MKHAYIALTAWMAFFTICHAQPQIMGEFFIKPSVWEEISAKDTSQPKTSVAWANPAANTSFVSGFLIRTEENTLQPIVLAKDIDHEQLPAILSVLEFTSLGDGWQVGAFKGFLLPREYIETVLKTKTAEPKPAPVFVMLYPHEISNTLNADKKFADQTASTLTGSLLRAFADIESLELRGTPNPQAFRVVTIIKSRPDSELNSFLDQRLPVALPREHSLLPVTQASGYGYFCYNAPATARYLTHWSEILAQSMPESSKALAEIAKHMDCSNGYGSFLKINDELGPRMFLSGSWNRSNTPELMTAMYALAHPLANLQQVETTQPFSLGGAPVWRLHPPASTEKIIPAPPPPANIFYSVSEGNITQASSPEALTELNQDLAPPAIDNNSFSKNFGHLPTLCFQAKYKTESLMQTLLRQTPTKPTPTSLYAAASMGEGQMAITLDIPYELLGGMTQDYRTKEH